VHPPVGLGADGGADLAATEHADHAEHVED
jgi:hypothetical protein